MDKVIFILYGIQLGIISIIDGRERRIPNKLLGIALLLFGVVMVWWIGGSDGVARADLVSGLLHRLGDAAVFLLIFLVFHLLSKNSLGMGDVKLLFVHFVYLARDMALVSLLLSLIILVLYSLVDVGFRKLRMTKKPKKTDYPFAPFLFIGYLILGKLMA